MSHLKIILAAFIIFEDVVFLQPKKEISEGSTLYRAQGSLSARFHPNFLFLRFSTRS